MNAGRRAAARPRRPRPARIGHSCARRDAIMAEGTLLVEAAGHEIAVTSPSKVFFPERGETKLDLVRYYLDKTVEEPLMRAMKDRPRLLPRATRPGRGGPA